MISSDWRYDLIIHELTGKASLPVYFCMYNLFHSHFCKLIRGKNKLYMDIAAVTNQELNTA